MNFTRTLAWIRNLFFLGALASALLVLSPLTGSAQPPLSSPASSAPSKSTAQSQTASGSQLWPDYIWHSIPASDLGSLTPSPVSRAYEASGWQPLFINSRFRLDAKAKRLLSRLHCLGEDAIDPGPFELDRLSEIIRKLRASRSSLEAADPQFDTTRGLVFLAGQDPDASTAGPGGSTDSTPSQADIQAVAAAYRAVLSAASQADIRLTTDFFLYSKEMDPVLSVEEGIKALLGQESNSGYFAELEPKGFGYQSLRAAYKKYCKLADRHTQVYVNFASTARPGDRGTQVRRLQERLGQEGFYSGEASGVYDRATQRAVRDFQAANMLRPDGITGRTTLARINISFEQKAAMIAYSLKAIRNSPCRQFERFIRVNIPQFMLAYYNNGQIEKTEKVIVGKSSGKKVNRQGKIVGENQTPTMFSQIYQIIYNPRWYVDGRIRLELNARAGSNPEWFEEHGYVKMESRYRFGEHRLFQKSGPKNALGRVKFDFLNPYAVYLHDTDQRYLFAKSRRDLSHGCIRVNNALNLAQTILADEANPYISKIQSILSGTREAFIKLSQPIPISVEYIPVVASDDGQIVFAGDPYGYLADGSQIARKW
ncbi:MAG: L,D-transpeptidase family protein [Syntrophobacteraceae bacterium]